MADFAYFYVRLALQYYQQQIAAEQELEASERRVHVMTSDVATLKRKLAEHADVLKQARALADKVWEIAYPWTQIGDCSYYTYLDVRRGRLERSA